MADIFPVLGLCFLALVVAPFQALGNLDSQTPLNKSITHGGVTVNLLSHDHINSPFSKPRQSRSERVLNAVQRSRERHQFITGGQLSDTDNSNKAYTSPRVYPNNGSYVMEIILGTPPRTLTAIADTGSDLLWIQCRGCDECLDAPDPNFDPKASSTYSAVSCIDPYCLSVMDYYDDPCPANGTGACSYGYLYADGSETTGTFSKETITLLSTDGPTLSFPGFYFGCGFNQTGTFGSTDGLVGLGRGDLSLVTQLGPQINHTFSYCLVDFDSGISKASPLTFGTTGGRNLSLAYTPLLRNIYAPSFYYVSVIGITIGGKVLDFPEDSLAMDDLGYGGTIVDSGTTFTYLSYDVYEAFLGNISKLINYPLVFSAFTGFELCYNISGVFRPKYPTVMFRLKDVNVTLQNENLFTIVDDAEETACLAFQPSIGLVGPAISILGNIWQQNLLLEFDIANNKLGIAPTKC